MYEILEGFEEAGIAFATGDIVPLGDFSTSQLKHLLGMGLILPFAEEEADEPEPVEDEPEADESE